MISRRHFEKVKNIFGFDNIEEFKNKLIEMKSDTNASRQYGFPGRWDRVLAIYQVIDPEKIGVER